MNMLIFFFFQTSGKIEPLAQTVPNSSVHEEIKVMGTKRPTCRVRFV